MLIPLLFSVAVQSPALARKEAAPKAPGRNKRVTGKSDGPSGRRNRREEAKERKDKERRSRRVEDKHWREAAGENHGWAGFSRARRAFHNG